MAPESNERMTRQRLAVLEAVRDSHGHPSAEEVHARARLRAPRISLGTVYRNLDFLSRAGLIRTLDGEPGKRRFDGNVAEDHYHVRCVGCGSVGDLPKTAVTRLEHRAEGMTDYDVRGWSLTFTGICPECRARADGEDG